MLGQLKDYFIGLGFNAYFDAPGILEVLHRKEYIRIWEHEDSEDENYIYTDRSKKFKNWFELCDYVRKVLE